jgi:hypothetical protein
VKSLEPLTAFTITRAPIHTAQRPQLDCRHRKQQDVFIWLTPMLHWVEVKIIPFRKPLLEPDRMNAIYHQILPSLNGLLSSSNSIDLCMKDTDAIWTISDILWDVAQTSSLPAASA